jgi:hypothetical protein
MGLASIAANGAAVALGLGRIPRALELLGVGHGILGVVTAYLIWRGVSGAAWAFAVWAAALVAAWAGLGFLDRYTIIPAVGLMVAFAVAFRSIRVQKG